MLFTVHGFLRASYEVTEDDGLHTVFKPFVKGTGRHFILNGTITAEASGTAGKQLIVS